MLTGENRRTWIETSLSATLSTADPTRTALNATRLRRVKAAADLLQSLRY